jgi:hypothetical protein
VDSNNAEIVSHFVFEERATYSTLAVSSDVDGFGAG